MQKTRRRVSKYQKRRFTRRQRGGDNEMIKAIEAKDLAKVKQLIVENRGISQPTVTGMPPLYLALHMNDMAIFQALITAGSDPNAGRPRWNPLVLAAQIGSMDIVQQLLAANADVNRYEEGSYGISPLYCAVLNRMEDMVTVLLEHGANPNLQSFVYNPLQTALMNDDTAIAQKLLNYGANPNVNNAVRHKLIKEGNLDILQSLITHPQFQKNAITDIDFTIAAKKGYIEIIKLFLHEGIEFKKNPGPNDDSPLHAAIENGHYETVRFLLDYGVDVNSKNFFGQTSLMIAVSIACELPIHSSKYPKYMEIIRMLLEDGANPNISDNEHSTPLHIATMKGYDEIANILRNAGAENIIQPDERVPVGLENNQEYNEEYNEEYNSENDEELEAHVELVPSIPPEMNRPIQVRIFPAPERTDCFNPYMASTVPIGENQVVFYIYNKPEGNKTPTLSKVACIDNESEEDGRTIELYRMFLDDINYLYYRCKETVPEGSIFVDRDQIYPEPIRRLAFDSNIYVYESQAQKIQAGRKYALIPTNNRLGRIVSETLLQTQNAVGAEHCQTDYADKLYEIFEIQAAKGGRKTYKRNRRTTRRRY